MSAQVDDPKRRVIPRWRDSRVTAQLGELDAAASHGRAWSPDLTFLTQQLEIWRRHRSPTFAADLMGSALVLQQEEIAREAAEAILQEDGPVSAIARSVAERIVGAVGPQRTPQTPQEDDNLTRFRRIHSLRQQLRLEPRNPIQWIDLAREYSVLGQVDAAGRAIRSGLGLAPHNRFVVRSAARYFLHQGDPELAHDLLRRTPAAQHDPWIMAAEIATATVLGRTPRLANRGRTVLEARTFSPKHTAELAGALGTLELDGGKRRVARKLFEQSLIRPNENVVAQASWTARHTTGIEFDSNFLQIPLSFEARAWESYKSGGWPAAAAAASEWLEDEPFSSRPAEFGSFVASVALQDYSAGISFARRGLIANPTDSLLLNNLAFALANAGRLPEAVEAFSRIERAGLSPSMQVAYLATAGLLQYRAGLPEVGRTLYRRAIEFAEKGRLKRERAMAFLFFAREELSSASPTLSKVLEEARSARADLPSVDAALTEKLSKDLIRPDGGEVEES